MEIARLLQQWFGLSNDGLQNAIYDSQAMTDFLGLDLSRENVPDATAPLRFRRLGAVPVR